MNTGSTLVLPAHLPESVKYQWPSRDNQSSQPSVIERRTANPPDFHARIQSTHFLERRIFL
jgi:hypothetical protein